MKTPKFLLGSALIFWGVFSNLLPWAVIMALLLEVQPYINWRRSTPKRDFYLIGDFSTIIFILISAIAFFNNQQRLFIYQILQWLPFAFFPLILVEYYADSGKTPLGALVYRYRKVQDYEKPDMSLGYLFFFLCLLSASATPERSVWFFPITALLLAWALWHCKPASTRMLRWTVLFAVTGCIGILVAVGLNKLHHVLEDYSIDWLESLFESGRDPYQTTTAMGKIGNLKQSNKIIMRVKTETGGPFDQAGHFLLQEAVYSVFFENAWFNKKLAFSKLKAETAQNSWQLANMDAHAPPITLHVYAQKGKSRGLLPLLLNTGKISTDADISLSRNNLGAVQFRANPHLDQYSLTTAATLQYTSPASDSDLLLPIEQRDAIMQINAQLNLNANSANDNIRIISDYFASNFSYSLYQKTSLRKRDPLSHFLRSSHRGHCEFFASATVLLLRSAGIPARYAVGYSVQEYDRDDDVYIVRARHRHAWTQAYVNGHWINLDTTPPAWYETEMALASYYEPVLDWFSRLRFKLRLWQLSNTDQSLSQFAIIIGIILLLLFLTRLKGGHRWIRNTARSDAADDQYNVTEYLLQINRIQDALPGPGTTRQIHEPLLTWQQRVRTVIKDAELVADLRDIILLYYRLRYAIPPQQDNTVDKTFSELRAKIDTWLTKWRATLQT